MALTGTDARPCVPTNRYTSGRYTSGRRLMCVVSKLLLLLRRILNTHPIYMCSPCYNDRKSPRATFHDYKAGIYFITICTKDKRHYFGKVQDGTMHLSPIGAFCQQQWEKVSEHYPYATVPLFVVMPNHVHAIVSINQETECAVQETDRETLAIVVGGIKRSVSSFARQHEIAFGWQSRYYDRIIRNRREGNNIANYIENNVARWDSDEYYSKMSSL